MNPTRNPVGWFEIYVQNMERAKKFYQNVLQVTLSKLECPGEMDLDLWAFPSPPTPDAPGCPGALVKMKDKDSGIGGTLIYFSCLDCAVECGRVEENGGSVHFGKMPIAQYGFISIVIDTEGNMIGLHSMQ